MRFALYSRRRAPAEQLFTETVAEYLTENRFEVLLHRNCAASSWHDGTFDSHEALKAAMPVDYMVSLGGDGTFIDAANLVGDLGIPMAGINTGRIGFLADIKREKFKDCLQMLGRRQYGIVERSLLHLESSRPAGLRRSFALNEVTVRATGQGSVNAITVRADGQKINTYWADGLIVATPTGSTAYSLSCGGPILHPQTQVHVLTPIASHSLSVRPLVIPAEAVLQIEVDGNSGQYALSLDNERTVVDGDIRLLISKEKFTIQTISFQNTDFYNIIREKLFWGADKRNR